MKLFFSQAFALTFTATLMRELSEPRSIGGRAGVHFVNGQLRLRAHGENSNQHVQVTYEVGSDWLQRPPVARANCSFLKRELDWHVFADGSLCYVLGEQWQEELNRAYLDNYRSNKVLGLAAGWCLSAVDSLLVRHLIGRRLGLIRWPPEWADWRHGIDGVEQFRRTLCSN